MVPGAAKQSWQEGGLGAGHRAGRWGMGGKGRAGRGGRWRRAQGQRRSVNATMGKRVGAKGAGNVGMGVNGGTGVARRWHGLARRGVPARRQLGWAGSGRARAGPGRRHAPPVHQHAHTHACHTTRRHNNNGNCQTRPNAAAAWACAASPSRTPTRAAITRFDAPPRRGTNRCAPRRRTMDTPSATGLNRVARPIPPLVPAGSPGRAPPPPLPPRPPRHSRSAGIREPTRTGNGGEPAWHGAPVMQPCSVWPPARPRAGGRTPSGERALRLARAFRSPPPPIRQDAGRHARKGTTHD